MHKSNLKEQFFKEIKLHYKLNHRNIIKLHRVFENENFMFLVLELAKNGSLQEVIDLQQSLSEVEVKLYLGQIIAGIKYIHECGIIHRDLKPANLLLTEKNEIKIADFGLAAVVPTYRSKRKTFCGTPFYIAPEIIQKNGHSLEVDYWSLGVTIYNMIFGQCPFYSDNADEIYLQVLNKKLEFPTGISRDARELIRGLLDKDYKQRWKFEDISRCKFLTRKTLLDQCFTESNASKKVQRSKTEFNDSKICESFRGKNLINSTIENKIEKLPSIDNHLPTRETLAMNYVCFNNRTEVAVISYDKSIQVLFADSTSVSFNLNDEYYHYRRNRLLSEFDKIAFSESPSNLTEKHKVLLELRSRFGDLDGGPKRINGNPVFLNGCIENPNGMLFMFSDGSYEFFMRTDSQLKIYLVKSQWQYLYKREERVSEGVMRENSDPEISIILTEIRNLILNNNI